MKNFSIEVVPSFKKINISNVRTRLLENILIFTSPESKTKFAVTITQLLTTSFQDSKDYVFFRYSNLDLSPRTINSIRLNKPSYLWGTDKQRKEQSGIYDRLENGFDFRCRLPPVKIFSPYEITYQNGNHFQTGRASSSEGLIYCMTALTDEEASNEQIIKTVSKEVNVNYEVYSEVKVDQNSFAKELATTYADEFVANNRPISSVATIQHSNLPTINYDNAIDYNGESIPVAFNVSHGFVLYDDSKKIFNRTIEELNQNLCDIAIDMRFVKNELFSAQREYRHCLTFFNNANECNPSENFVLLNCNELCERSFDIARPLI